MLKNNEEILHCIYCKKKVGLKELVEMDSIIRDLDSEEAEFIWDQLPEIAMDERDQDKFLHMSDLGYKVLNVCMDCYQKAVKKYQNS